MRASLSDDFLVPGLDPVARVAAGLDDDPKPWKIAEVNPTLTVYVRTRPADIDDRYDDNGDPVFTWAALVEDVAIEWESRTEVDEVAGSSWVSATATILYAGDEKVDETAYVDVSPGDVHSGGQFRVTKVAQVPGRLELVMVRIDGDHD